MPSMPFTGAIWSKAVQTEVVPRASTTEANRVMDILVTSVCTCGSMSPGTRCMPEASMISVSSPTVSLTSPMAAIRSPAIATPAS